ncbi:hypothetical protein KCP69_13925 [Salmonella enterica subsp. enterica]|nr:hypothetical protein KCP69_13925 [Salmonella enterica subsp. enterica]
MTDGVITLFLSVRPGSGASAAPLPLFLNTHLKLRCGHPRSVSCPCNVYYLKLFSSGRQTMTHFFRNPDGSRASAVKLRWGDYTAWLVSRSLCESKERRPAPP